MQTFMVFLTNTGKLISTILRRELVAIALKDPFSHRKNGLIKNKSK